MRILCNEIYEGVGDAFVPVHTNQGIHQEFMFVVIMLYPCFLVLTIILKLQLKKFAGTKTYTIKDINEVRLEIVEFAQECIGKYGD